MSLPKKLVSYLEKNKVRYDILKHRIAYTAYDLAATLRVPEVGVTKALLLKTEQGLVLALLSAAHQLDLARVLKVLKAKKARILKESEMVKALKLGRKPLHAFSKLYKIPVVMERALLKNKSLILPSGAFTESLKLSIKSFLTLENPIVGTFGVRRKSKAAKQKKKNGTTSKKKRAPIRRIMNHGFPKP
ncbi:YbaK/EbsC family protein [Candidatus Uhrbacteria bacterium]|nr:YbaK/EbsC family protein [Candidatus Uhrbacteria bacterium]